MAPRPPPAALMGMALEDGHVATPLVSALVYASLLTRCGASAELILLPPDPDDPKRALLQAVGLSSLGHRLLLLTGAIDDPHRHSPLETLHVVDVGSKVGGARHAAMNAHPTCTEHWPHLGPAPLIQPAQHTSPHRTPVPPAAGGVRQPDRRRGRGHAGARVWRKLRGGAAGPPRHAGAAAPAARRAVQLGADC